LGDRLGYLLLDRPATVFTELVGWSVPQIRNELKDTRDLRLATSDCLMMPLKTTWHRFCVNHFFRDLAKPVLVLDSTAKKKK